MNIKRRKSNLSIFILILQVFIIGLLVFDPGISSAIMSDDSYEVPGATFLSGGGQSGDENYSLFSSIGLFGGVGIMSDGQYVLQPGYIWGNTPPEFITRLSDMELIQPEGFKIYIEATDKDGQPIYWDYDHFPHGAVFRPPSSQEEEELLAANPNIDVQRVKVFDWDTSEAPCSSGFKEFRDIFFLVADHDPADLEHPENYKARIDAWINANNLNEYGDPIGTPVPSLVDPNTGQYWGSRHHYILSHHSNLLEDLYLAVDFQSVTYTLQCCAAVPGINVAGEATVCQGSLVNLTVTAKDPAGGDVALDVLNKPSDASFDKEKGLFAWTPNVPGTYCVTFTAMNDCNKQVEREQCITVLDETDPACSVIPDPNKTITYHLTSGYNPVGICLDFTGKMEFAEDICNRLETQIGSDTEILRYNPDTASWDRYMCRFNAPVNFAIDPLGGYFIKSGNTYDWMITGQSVSSPATVSLRTGYNCVALPKWKGPLAASDILGLINAQEIQCTRVIIYHMPTASWSYHLIEAPSYNNFIVQPEEAFFVYCRNSGQWTITE